MAELKVGKIYQQIANTIEKNKSKVTQEAEKDIKQVTAIIELARTKRGYRFGKVENDDITKAFEQFKTKIDKSEVAKTLLSIGNSEKELLTAEEIIKVLRASTGMNPERQNRIFEFVKYARENDFGNVPRLIRRHYSFDTMMNKRFRDDNDITEEIAKISYSAILNSRITMHGSVPNPESYIFNNERSVIYAIAKCKDIPSFVHLLSETGPTETLKAIPNDLTKIVQYAEGDIDLAYDLAKNFDPPLVRLIRSYIEEYPDLKDFIKYYEREPKSIYESLANLQRMIIHRLGLGDKITIVSPKREPYRDAMLYTLPGNYGTKR